MDLDLRRVRYFAALAEELHFGRAAVRLYISQPALSREIRKLEEQVGEPLLVRDSRHVALTPRGERFAQDANRLLAMADVMQQPSRIRSIRIAHIFELSTSRVVADEFARVAPDVEMSEHAMDSITQLNAVMQHRLDVGIVRVTPRMRLSHPTGWCHRLLRLEPLVLVGGPTDQRRLTASFFERPLDVFGDPQESGTYSAHGQYLTALEAHLGLTMRWLGTPGAFSHCLTQVSRAAGPSRYLEFYSYAERYVEIGLPMFWPQEIQPYYPWSLVWRQDDHSDTTGLMLEIAADVSRRHGWLEPYNFGPHLATPWLPPDEPVRGEEPLSSYLFEA